MCFTVSFICSTAQYTVLWRGCNLRFPGSAFYNENSTKHVLQLSTTAVVPNELSKFVNSLFVA